ncbi:unnamed protein product [Diamesa hyperborea]
MDLSRNNLVEIPMDVFEPSLEFLDLSYNKLHDLNPVLIRCTQLKVLNLSDNHLEDIPDALKSLKELTELNLSHNKLQYIPLVINQFAQLTKLDLSNNSIEKIYGTITEMITLRELRLNDCSICFLPANLGRLVNLEVLEVRGNGLEGLPPTFKLLIKLTLLDIGRNYFRVLPLELGTLKELTELYVDENQLYDLNVCGRLKKLKHLDISRNDIDDFPIAICNCTQLQIIDADMNRFQELPAAICNLRELQILNLNFNDLLALHENIGYCEQLEELKIQENYLMELPPNIGLLRKLKLLCVNDNKIYHLPDELASCQELTILNLANNTLQRLPDNIGQLRNLVSLNLINNQLAFLPLSIHNIGNLGGLLLSVHQSKGQLVLTKIHMPSVGYVLTSPFLVPKYEAEPTKKRKDLKLAFQLAPETDDIDDQQNSSHFSVTRTLTPTPKEMKKLQKSARLLVPSQRIAKTPKSYESFEKVDVEAEITIHSDESPPISPPQATFEIKEARVTTNSRLATSSSFPITYANVPRQRRSIDRISGSFLELSAGDMSMNSSMRNSYAGTPSELQPLRPPPYIVAKKYSKKTKEEMGIYESLHQQQQLRAETESPRNSIISENLKTDMVTTNSYSNSTDYNGNFSAQSNTG